MQQLYDILLKTGLRPFSFFSETATLERNLNRSELTTLLILSFRSELAMSELSAELGAPLSSMTSIAKRLEKKGYIERFSSMKDQRITLVRMTEEGKKVAAEARKIMDVNLHRVEQALTAEEMEQFLSLVFKIMKAFRNSEIQEKDVKESSVKRIRIDD
ncbi:MarR family winged helix-turn-helix transcriptional regulator [Candidatus Pristimantibacillus sp. PTI5]|uniref:MarR family winged helix-turn-helix transcriptional regulator n=1 Tax=Candidatus Pristimantibacillus sp. PTI5 TaxID=3400422 RepID=UPI003B029DEA